MKTIRLIHNLPRSGGTIISKCLGAQKDVTLLSEIHPKALLISQKMGAHTLSFDPIFQSQTWNNLFEKDEYKKISNSDLKFEEKIDLIFEKTELTNKKLIIRDWAFVDFFGKPFIEPSYKNSLFEILNKKYNVLNLYIVRHPLKLYESCFNNLGFFRRDYNPDFFIKGYKNYFLNTSKNNIFLFENFILDPEKSLKAMCDTLKIVYDENYLNKLKDINLTGDPNAKISINISTKDSVSKKKLANEDDLDKIKNHSDFISLMKDLKDYY